MIIFWIEVHNLKTIKCAFDSSLKSQLILLFSLFLLLSMDPTVLFGTIHRSHCTVDKLNIDGSAISNPSIAGAGGILRDHSGWWISDFSLHLGLATNNMVELAVVRQGLVMARNMSFKFI